MPPKRVTPEKVDKVPSLKRQIRKKVLSDSSSRTLPITTAKTAAAATKSGPKKSELKEGHPVAENADIYLSHSSSGSKTSFGARHGKLYGRLTKKN